jgi:hypothetical protein
MHNDDVCCVCGGTETDDHEGMGGCPMCFGVYCSKCAGYNRVAQLYVCATCATLTQEQIEAQRKEQGGYAQ